MAHFKMSQLPKHLPIRAVLRDLSLDFEVTERENLSGHPRVYNPVFPRSWSGVKMQHRLDALRQEKLLQELIQERGWSLSEFKRGLSESGIQLIKKKNTVKNRGDAARLLLDAVAGKKSADESC